LTVAGPENSFDLAIDRILAKQADRLETTVHKQQESVADATKV